MEETAIPTIALSSGDWNEVKRIVRHYLLKYTVWAFGSRVTGTHKTYSDLDLAIITEQPLSLEQMATIKDAFAESDMTIRVDLQPMRRFEKLFSSSIWFFGMLINRGMGFGRILICDPAEIIARST